MCHDCISVSITTYSIFARRKQVIRSVSYPTCIAQTIIICVRVKLVIESVSCLYFFAHFHT